MNQFVADTKNQIIFSAIVGSVYMLTGVFQFIFSLYSILYFEEINNSKFAVLDILLSRSDPMGALILILIASIFLYGFIELRKGFQEGIAYVYVGVLIALIFAAVSFLIISANFIDANMLHNPEMSSWRLDQNIKPIFYLGILPLLGYFLWKDKFLNININR